MTKQEFLTMSLPHGLKCQYNGIISFEKESVDDFFAETKYVDINHKFGNKIGLLKEIHVYKKYWVSRCGIYSRGLKSFYNGNGLFVLLVINTHIALFLLAIMKKLVPSINVYFCTMIKNE